ncbi:hypothetical protein BB560_004628, partial [Smittium megazygosporum]
NILRDNQNPRTTTSSYVAPDVVASVVPTAHDFGFFLLFSSLIKFIKALPDPLILHAFNNQSLFLVMCDFPLCGFGMTSVAALPFELHAVSSSTWAVLPAPNPIGLLFGDMSMNTPEDLKKIT